jgi:hypothetical protein
LLIIIDIVMLEEKMTVDKVLVVLLLVLVMVEAKRTLPRNKVFGWTSGFGRMVRSAERFQGL